MAYRMLLVGEGVPHRAVQCVSMDGYYEARKAEREGVSEKGLVHETNSTPWGETIKQFF